MYVKAFELLEKNELTEAQKIRTLKSFIKAENKNQFHLSDDPNSEKCHEIKMKGKSQSTWYIFIFKDGCKVLTLGDFLSKLIKNYDFNVKI